MKPGYEPILLGSGEALFAIRRAMAEEPMLKVTLPNLVDDTILDR